MAIIYVVIGDSGDRREYQQWMVSAHSTEKGARARVTELEETMSSFVTPTQNIYKRRDELTTYMRAHGDKSFCVHSHDAHYRYEPVEFES